jgi:hypothetical protein
VNAGLCAPNDGNALSYRLVLFCHYSPHPPRTVTGGARLCPSNRAIDSMLQALYHRLPAASLTDMRALGAALPARLAAAVEHHRGNQHRQQASPLHQPSTAPMRAPDWLQNPGWSWWVGAATTWEAHYPLCLPPPWQPAAALPRPAGGPALRPVGRYQEEEVLSANRSAWALTHKALQQHLDNICTRAKQHRRVFARCCQLHSFLTWLCALFSMNVVVLRADRACSSW